MWTGCGNVASAQPANRAKIICCFPSHPCATSSNPAHSGNARVYTQLDYIIFTCARGARTHHRICVNLCKTKSARLCCASELESKSRVSGRVGTQCSLTFCGRLIDATLPPRTHEDAMLVCVYIHLGAASPCLHSRHSAPLYARSVHLDNVCVCVRSVAHMLTYAHTHTVKWCAICVRVRANV